MRQGIDRIDIDYRVKKEFKSSNLFIFSFIVAYLFFYIGYFIYVAIRIDFRTCIFQLLLYVFCTTLLKYNRKSFNVDWNLSYFAKIIL